MADIQGMFRDAWAAALAGASAAEQEAEKAIARLAVAGFSPDDLRRHARELGGRLAAQRRELEASIDEGVRRAAARFVPSQEEIAALTRRLDAVSERLASLERAGPGKERTE